MYTDFKLILQRLQGFSGSPERTSAAYFNGDAGVFNLQASAVSNSQMRLRSASLSVINTNASMPAFAFLRDSAGNTLGQAFVVPSGQANCVFDFSRDPLALGQNKGYGIFLTASSSASNVARLTAYHTTEVVA